jgi:hypothetical protein
MVNWEKHENREQNSRFYSPRAWRNKLPGVFSPGDMELTETHGEKNLRIPGKGQA